MKARSEIRTMTKDVVDALLAMNTKNRPIKPSVVAAYKRDITSGNWFLTNQGIGVSHDSVLIDGQHRLTALAECGYPAVEMSIVWGLDPRSQKCVDQGAKRSMRDVMQLMFNHTVSRIVPAVCNILIKCNDGKFSGRSGTSTSAEVLSCFEENQDYILPIIEVPDFPHYFPAPVIAAAVIAVRENPKNEARIIEFLSSVRSGENLNKTMPAYHLRNYLIMSHGPSAGSCQSERFAKTRKALIAYLRGESMGVLRA